MPRLSDRSVPPPSTENSFHPPISQILEQIADAVLLLDAQSHILYLNTRAQQLFPETQTGIHFFSTPLDDELDPVRQKIERAAIEVIQGQAIRETSAYLPQRQQWLDIQIHPSDWGLSIYIKDVSAHQQGLARLRLLEQAIIASNNGVVISDMQHPKQALIYCNPAFEKLTGYAQAEILGRNCRFLQGPETDPATVEELRQCIRERRDGRVILRNYRKDGTPFWNELRISPVRDSEGQVTHYIGVQNDITERKQAENALRESEQREREKAAQLEDTLCQLQRTQAKLIQYEKMVSLGQLVAGVAHEINNPVSFIYSNLNYANSYAQDLLNLVRLYQQHYPTPGAEISAIASEVDLDFINADFPKLLDSMKAGAERIRQIVLSLRNFSRLDEAELKPVNLHEGIESSLTLLQHRLNAQTNRPAIEVIREYSHLPKVQCYPGQLNQVFMNLLNNAIDALEQGVSLRVLHSPESLANTDSVLPPPPTIRIRTEIATKGKNQEYITIRIADNGPGFQEEVKHRLFDPFFTTKPVGQGTGLGLSICYEVVVEQHNGDIRCISAPGLGAEFIIELPLS
ncbi:MAG: PAS domain S-box protein [Desertifilum sp. SIO1I2]|nr:PAS domain S-box protein [Desertifilum sp. SIO1I2]